MTLEKQRVRVPAGSRRVAAPVATDIDRPGYSSKWLRDTRSGVIASRPAYLRESRDEIRVAWQRTAALAIDLIQNSGKLRGAADQVITDTVGTGLKLNPTPDLASLGYDDKEKREFVDLIKKRWKRYANNPAECDLRGKLTINQQVDIGIRWNLAYGETLGLVCYMGSAERRKYRIRSGTKICLVPPSRLIQDTNEMERMFQGVKTDINGRPVAYRLKDRNFGTDHNRDYPAFDREGRPLVMHIFDPFDATDMRGISVLAAAFRRLIQHEILVDATLQTAVLQTVFAATLTSPDPSAQAFEALSALEELDGEDGKALKTDMLGYFQSRLDRARDSTINVSGDPQVSHLVPGEDFKLHAVQAPGETFFPLNTALDREVARAIGISYSSFALDHNNATYSSVRMENASVWPVVERRRARGPARQCQITYEAWLDEEIGEGRIDFKGGYQAYRANRGKVCSAIWHGPPKPSADDKKSAQASTERLSNKTSALAIEASEMGLDSDELFELQKAEHDRYVAAGMTSPHAGRLPGPSKDDDEKPRKAQS